jgi:hypothetical protein
LRANLSSIGLAAGCGGEFTWTTNRQIDFSGLADWRITPDGISLNARPVR